MKNFNSNLKFVWKYTKGTRIYIISYILLHILNIIISIIVPIYTAKEIVYLTSNLFHQLLLTALLVFGIEILRNTVNRLSNICSMKSYKTLVKALQKELSKEVLKLENSSLNKQGSGVFIQRLTSDTNELSDIFNMLTEGVSGVVTNMGILVAILFVNVKLFIYFLLMTIVLFIIENIRTRNLTARRKVYKKKREKLTGFIGELVRGARDIKMLNAEEPFIKKADEYLVDAQDYSYDMFKKNNALAYVRGCVRDLIDLMFVVLCIVLIKNDELTIPSAIIVHNYSGRVFQMITSFGYMIEYYRSFGLTANRIKEIIDGSEFKKETFGTKHIKKVKGDFEFKNVSFAYEDDQPIIKDLSFKVDANTTVGFVGKSGAGKSTIFSLLCKLYNINSGSITIDGININELDKESIRGNITIISQNPYIFNLSIKDNLKIVKENLTDKEIKRACKIACLDDFIESLPDKYDTIIGEGGVTLSGGQKQRLAIARALVQKTEIILFDEATSALDNETQLKIRQAIKNLKGEYTILIIAHRFSTILDSDKIYVIDDGKVIGSGTHKSLLKTNKVYKTLYEEELKGK